METELDMDRLVEVKIKEQDGNTVDITGKAILAVVISRNKESQSTENRVLIGGFTSGKNMEERISRLLYNAAETIGQIGRFSAYEAMRMIIEGAAKYGDKNREVVRDSINGINKQDR